jgi:hypothetical protein
MKIFDYSDLIRVINNVELREEQEKLVHQNNLKQQYEDLEYELVMSDIFADWYNLQKLCKKAGIRLSVSNQGKTSMGYIMNHPESYSYCKEYKDDGLFCFCMSSGGHWSDYYGFKYDDEHGLHWLIQHSTKSFLFYGFNSETEKYEIKIKLLNKFKETYEDYRNFILSKVDEKFKNRIKPEDIIEEI